MDTKSIFHVGVDVEQSLQLQVFEGESDHEKCTQQIGWYFNAKEIKKELPYLSNTPDKIWFILRSEGIIIGFGSLKPRKKRIEFSNLYVFPEKRGKGYGKLLIDLRLDYLKTCKKQLYAAVQNHMLVRTYKARGFTEYRKTKNYTFMRRECLK